MHVGVGEDEDGRKKEASVEGRNGAASKKGRAIRDGIV